MRATCHFCLISAAILKQGCARAVCHCTQTIVRHKPKPTIFSSGQSISVGFPSAFLRQGCTLAVCHCTQTKVRRRPISFSIFKAGLHTRSLPLHPDESSAQTKINNVIRGSSRPLHPVDSYHSLAGPRRRGVISMISIRL